MASSKVLYTRYHNIDIGNKDRLFSTEMKFALALAAACAHSGFFIAGIIAVFAAICLAYRFINDKFARDKDSFAANNATITIKYRIKEHNGEFYFAVPKDKFEGFSEEGKEEVLRSTTVTTIMQGAGP